MHAPYRPALDAVSLAAISQRTQTHPDEPGHPGATAPAGTAGNVAAGTRDAPGAVLWAALCLALPEGTTVPGLMAETGMSRPWVYQRLADLAGAGQVYQVSRGRWRAVPGSSP